MSKIAIKICGLSTPAMVDCALAGGATHVGLVFFPKSPRNVSIEQAAALAAHAAGRAQVVGLFVDPAEELLTAVRSSVALDAIQLHGGENPARAAQIRAAQGIEVWKAIGVRKQADLAAARDFVGAADRILYDAKPPKDSELPGGTGLRIDWSLMRGWHHPLPWLLAGGLTPDNVAEAVAITGAPGVDVSSGVESTPGVKDAGRITAFCRAVLG
jgi:phosphoribosylanthranilate isomerase